VKTTPKDPTKLKQEDMKTNQELDKKNTSTHWSFNFPVKHLLHLKNVAC